jgi:hypothetical protein
MHRSGKHQPYLEICARAAKQRTHTKNTFASIKNLPEKEFDKLAFLTLVS